MSSFLRSGKRKSLHYRKVKGKKVMKEFSRRYKEMAYLYDLFTVEGITLTEDNIDEEVAKRSNVTLTDSLKKILLDEFSEKNEEPATTDSSDIES